MRTLLTLIALFTFNNVLAQGWSGRKINMGFDIIEPGEGSYFKLPAIVNVKLKATNLGPDTICVGDTLYYGLKIAAHSRRRLVFRTKSMLMPGESVFISDTITFKDRPSPPWVYNYGWTLFEIYDCFAYNTNNQNCRPIHTSYDFNQSRDSNNTDTSRLYYTNSQSSLENINSDVQCYPSPFTRDLTVNADFDIQHAVIRDLAGREAYRHHAGGKRQLLLQPGPLKTGIYLLELTDVDQRKHTVKIVKDDE